MKLEISLFNSQNSTQMSNAQGLLLFPNNIMLAYFPYPYLQAHMKMVSTAMWYTDMNADEIR